MALAPVVAAAPLVLQWRLRVPPLGTHSPGAGRGCSKKAALPAAEATPAWEVAHTSSEDSLTQHACRLSTCDSSAQSKERHSNTKREDERRRLPVESRWA
jgi:hypothetical protein